MVAMVTTGTVLTYAIYTVNSPRIGSEMMFTIPPVVYGIFRYLYLLYRREMGGNPSDLLLNDRALLVNTVLWMIALLVIIYGPEWGPAWIVR